MTPRFAIVPVEGTQEMCHALAGDHLDGAEWDSVKLGFQADWAAAIAASPSAGRIGAEALERAAKGIYRAKFPTIEDAVLDDHFAWYERGKADPQSCVHESNVALAYKFARAAFEAAGICVEGGAE